MDKKKFCFGIRLNDGYMEVVCKYRNRCCFYTDAALADALSHPEAFEEVDAYTNEKIPCDIWQ